MKERRKNILWEYNGDGIFKKEKYTRFWKTYWKRWSRRRDKKDIKRQLLEIKGVESSP